MLRLPQLHKLGGLQLTSRAALLAGGKSGPAITPGNPETSLLIRAIRQSDPKLKMPMAGEKLTEQEIADFSSWVQAGAALAGNGGKAAAPGPVSTSRRNRRHSGRCSQLSKPSLAAGQGSSVGQDCDRSLHPGQARAERIEAGQAG